VKVLFESAWITGLLVAPKTREPEMLNDGLSEGGRNVNKTELRAVVKKREKIGRRTKTADVEWDKRGEGK